MFYDHPIWLILYFTLGASNFAFLLASIRRRGLVSGTHARFMCNGVIRVTMVPAVAFWTMCTVEMAAREAPAPCGLSLVILVSVLHDIKQFRDDDDKDDWFTGRGTKMKKWLRGKATRAGTRLSGALGPTPAGAGA